MEILVAIMICFLLKDALAFLDIIEDSGRDQEEEATL